ncbi:MAG TPA: MgtC/SapB family protein [Lachnospiraceae bacterium]|nr:MgtC/SapB family protein [Lachnospiraceae bacterium]
MLYEVNMVSCTARLFLALILGGILGFSRERKGRPAGLRTYMVVCVSSALVMITNQYISQIYVNVDASRMGAQILSGIGFLGAGTIIVTGTNKVKGLTTAAGLWAAACLGLAVGIGFYYGAVIGGFMIQLIMEGMNRIDHYVMRNAKFMPIYIEFDSISQLSRFMASVRQRNIRINDLEIKRTGQLEEKDVAAIMTLQFSVRTDHGAVLEQLTSCHGVLYVEEI